jgi:[ribosomal protein S5]-alanine N-acetyltransferase
VTPDRERTLISSRLALEPIGPQHGEVLFDVLSDPSAYTFLPSDPPASPSALRERYAFLAHRQSPDGREVWLNWALRVLAAGTYVGVVQATVLPSQTALLAYELGTRHWGFGYASEACQVVLGELVEQYGTGTVTALVDTRNGRSIRLLERLGFARTGFVADADYFKGASSDEYVYKWGAP